MPLASDSPSHPLPPPLKTATQEIEGCLQTKRERKGGENKSEAKRERERERETERERERERERARERESERERVRAREREQGKERGEREWRTVVGGVRETFERENMNQSLSCLHNTLVFITMLFC